MSDQTPYTPCLPEARDDYATGVSSVLSLEDAYAAFDRLIAQVRAEALREAATIADEVDTQAERDLGIEYDGHAAEVAVRIRYRAARIEQGETDD